LSSGNILITSWGAAVTTKVTGLVLPVINLGGTQRLDKVVQYAIPMPLWSRSFLYEGLSPSPIHEPSTLLALHMQKPGLYQFSIPKGTDSHQYCLFFPATVTALQEGCMKCRVINHRGHAEKELHQGNNRNNLDFPHCQRTSSPASAQCYIILCPESQLPFEEKSIKLWLIASNRIFK
jgi:hypothetical protein